MAELWERTGSTPGHEEVQAAFASNMLLLKATEEGQKKSNLPASSFPELNCSYHKYNKL